MFVPQNACGTPPGKSYESPYNTGLGIIVDTDGQKLKELIDQIDGSKWEVTYYHQVRTNNDAFTAFDVNIQPALQKYNEIEKFLLYLNNGIDTNVDDISGEATVVTNIIPQPNDVFVGSMFGARTGIFFINEVNKQSYNLKNVYSVKFTLHSFMDTAPDDINNLHSKVVERYTYNKSFPTDNTTPTMLRKNYLRKKYLHNLVPIIANEYVSKFISREYNYLFMPTTAGLYYDSLLMNFLDSILSVEDVALYGGINTIDTISDSTHLFTIFDMLTMPDLYKLANCSTIVNIRNENFILAQPRQRPVYTTPITGMVDIANGSNGLNISDIGCIGTICTIIDNGKPIVNPAINNHHVFSPYFYTKDTINCGVLENAVLLYIDGEDVPDDVLEILVNSIPMLTPIESFYYVPIILMLLNKYTGRTF